MHQRREQAGVVGAIHFTGALADGENHFESSNGRIVLAVPPTRHFRLDVDTNNGGIQSAFALSERQSSKNHLEGSVGSDPATSIRVQTGNARIEIQEMKVGREEKGAGVRRIWAGKPRTSH